VAHERLLPPGDLEPFVAHFWVVQWSLRTPFVAETLPHPAVHVVVERNGESVRGEITGVHTGRFSRALQGDGMVFGIKFRPSMFQPFFGASLGSLANRVVPLTLLWPEDGPELLRTVAPESDLATEIEHASAFLRRRLPAIDPMALTMRDLVERMQQDRTIVRVEDAAAIACMDPRTLQRAFRKYVGAPPKWVIQRYRLHEAGEQLKSPSPPTLAALAADLGYADQAHFARDFRRFVGCTPTAFARRPR
jgi:AraC-like DNA-binding protein